MFLGHVSVQTKSEIGHTYFLALLDKSNSLKVVIQIGILIKHYMLVTAYLHFILVIVSFTSPISGEDVVTLHCA